MRRTTHVLLAAATLLGLGGLAACGDDQPTPTAGAASGCSTVTVDIGSFVFQPTPVKVHPCDSVEWKNTHDQAHTSTGTGEQRWDTGNVAPGSTSEAVRFPKAGTYAYVCALHPFMHGEVVVA